VSRILKTWGDSESGVAERLAPVVDRLDRAPDVTLAFLASGIEGIKIRLTTRAPDAHAAHRKIGEEEAAIRGILGTEVFGTDTETMEDVVLRLCASRGWTLAVFDGFTGGLVSERLQTRRPSRTEFGSPFLGALVAETRDVAGRILALDDPPDGGREFAQAAATGARRGLGSDAGLALWAERDVDPPGALAFGLDLDGALSTATARLPGDPEQVRRLACISALNFLRLKLLEGAGATA
jgi:nicotinamide-nucleotide amidase